MVREGKRMRMWMRSQVKAGEMSGWEQMSRCAVREAFFGLLFRWQSGLRVAEGFDSS